MNSPYRDTGKKLPGRPRQRRQHALTGGPTSPDAIKGWHNARKYREKLASGIPDVESLHYDAAKVSEYRSGTQGIGSLGGTADAHYYWGLDLWLIRERVRELDRNDPLLGQLVDRGLDNILGSGLRVDPQTGDEALDATLKELWEEWSSDPDNCDFAGRFTFDEIERLALRHTWIDGDVFVLLDDATGTVRMIEGDRIVSGKYTGEDHVIHGVRLDPETDKPITYYFAKLRPGERRYNFSLAARASMEMVDLPAENMIHVYFPKRASQTRGISAFAPVINELSMVGDVEFARLVKLQVSSCIAGFIQSDNPDQFALGGSYSDTSNYDDITDLEFGELTPGMIGRLLAGEKFTGYSPGVVSRDEGEFVESLIRRVGLTIGLPIEIALLTSKDTNFSGFRGVVEQYKITARVIQSRFKRLLRSRVYKWKVQQWVDEGKVPNVPTVAKHTILTPTWAYIDPEKDARADASRIAEGLASTRQIWNERGRDYSEGVQEMAEDAAAYIRALHDAAEGEGMPEDVTWRDLIGGGLNPGAGVPASLNRDGPAAEAAEAQASGRADGRQDPRRRHDQADQNRAASGKKPTASARDRSAEERDRKKEKRGDVKAPERQAGAKTAEQRGVKRPKKGNSERKGKDA